jgi:hypothetical protein
MLLITDRYIVGIESKTIHTQTKFPSFLAELRSIYADKSKVRVRGSDHTGLTRSRSGRCFCGVGFKREMRNNGTVLTTCGILAARNEHVIGAPVYRA